MTVAIDGRISGAVINSSSGFARLDEACLSEVCGQRTVPATEDGKPVESRHHAHHVEAHHDAMIGE
jgi:hypothetical protein